jgi:hypothetical protein
MLGLELKGHNYQSWRWSCIAATWFARTNKPHIKHPAESCVCWLAAHKEINQKILDEIPQAVCNRIKKNLPRDLTKVGQKELLDQFLNANASII